MTSSGARAALWWDDHDQRSRRTVTTLRGNGDRQHSCGPDRLTRLPSGRARTDVPTTP